MERLTSNNDDLKFLVEHLNKNTNFDGNKILKIREKLKAYEDTGLEPEDILSNTKTISRELNNALEELMGYKDLEEQGRLIKLPCNEGDTIYVLEPNGVIRKCKVYNITTNIYADSNKNDPYWKGFEIKDNLFGKTVFLTREEAEHALGRTKI